jgi:hypothetical protein
VAIDQYLLIPFLGEWTSIYQLFWCELQGYKVLTHCHIGRWWHIIYQTGPGPEAHFLKGHLCFSCFVGVKWASKEVVEETMMTGLRVQQPLLIHYLKVFPIADVTPPIIIDESVSDLSNWPLACRGPLGHHCLGFRKGSKGKMMELGC